MVSGFYKWLIIPVLAMFHLAPNQSQIATDRHPFFVCVTEVNHNATASTLEISSKLFMDDFEKVLTQKYKTVVNIGTTKDKVLLDRQIGQYLHERFALKANGKPVSFTYLGHEIEEDAVFCYLEVSNVPSVSKIDIHNSILHDLNNNQVNILHVTVNGSRKSHKLDFPDTAVSFSF